MPIRVLPDNLGVDNRACDGFSIGYLLPADVVDICSGVEVSGFRYSALFLQEFDYHCPLGRCTQALLMHSQYGTPVAVGGLLRLRLWGVYVHMFDGADIHIAEEVAKTQLSYFVYVDMYNIRLVAAVVEKGWYCLQDCGSCIVKCVLFICVSL